MKFSTVKACLDEYDKNKGVGRIFVEEKNIKRLRAFCEKFKDEDKEELTSKGCIELIEILLRKRTWNE